MTANATAPAEGKTKLRPPPMYQIILLNDAVTPMDFVVQLLQRFFQFDLAKATEVMLTVHHQGSAVCAVCPQDVAITKTDAINQHSRAHGHPLLCVAEPQ